MVKRVFKDRMLLQAFIAGAGIVLVSILTLFMLVQNKVQHDFEQHVKAEREYHYIEMSYKAQYELLKNIRSFYDVDSQVSYDEFALLVNTLLDEHDDNDAYIYQPLEVGWFSIETGSNKNILPGKSGSNFIINGKSDNVYLNKFRLSPSVYDQSEIKIFKDGYQILARKSDAKIPDETSDDNLFAEDGYFYTIVDVDALLQKYSTSLGADFNVELTQQPLRNDTADANSRAVFEKRLGYLSPDIVLSVQYENQKNILNMYQNFWVIVVFVLGVAVSFIVARYVGFLLQQNDFFKQSSLQAKQKADLSETMLIQMLEALPVSVFGKDVQNNYTFSFFNKEAEKLFRMSKSYMLGKNDFDLWPEEEAAWFRKTDENVVKKGEVVDVPCEQVTPANGSVRLVHTRKVPIFDHNGNPAVLLGVAIDITDRVDNEKELERHRYHLENIVKERTAQLENALEKAEEFSRMKSDFLATMSHEIRTPMNGILGMAELIQSAGSPQQVERYAKIIINSGETLQQVIDDILDFSKIEAGKLSIQTMPVNLDEIVHDVAGLYDLQARDKALEVVVSYKPGTEQFVYADPVRLQQILSNMLLNAIKFTEKGYIEIVVENDGEASVQDDEIALKFMVKDTGDGLSPEAQSKIFEKFMQGDGSTTRQYGGAGLGLSICKSLVELMGGDIGVESDQGAGATFWFSIPFRRNLSEVYKQPKPPILKNVKVLVVDDIPVVCDLLREQLGNAGMICDSATSGKQALEKMLDAADGGEPYQMIAIDYLMPGMNGDALARAINDHETLREACLIMLTSAANQLSDYYFEQKGFSAYLAKPITNQTLIEGFAVIWERYNSGEKDAPIAVDLRAGPLKQEVADEVKLSGVKVLVAEDNLVNQVFIQEILSEMDVEYTLVSNGQEALDKIQEQPFDLVIMDCLMPVMDGFEASKEICKLKQSGEVNSDLSILALTANAMVGDREKCIEAGMDDYLPKPVRQRELKAKLYALITKDAYAEHSDGERDVVDATGKSSAQMKVDDAQVILDEESIESARKILKDRFVEIIDVYIVNSQEQIDEILQAIQGNNVNDIIRPAHTLKSASKRMGAVKLSEIAQDVEHQAKEMQKFDTGERDVQIFQTQVEQMTEVLSQTKVAFQKIAA